MESPLIGWPEIDLITKDGWSPFHFPIKSDQKKREKEKKRSAFLFVLLVLENSVLLLLFFLRNEEHEFQVNSRFVEFSLVELYRKSSLSQ